MAELGNDTRNQLQGELFNMVFKDRPLAVRRTTEAVAAEESQTREDFERMVPPSDVHEAIDRRRQQLFDEIVGAEDRNLLNLRLRDVHQEFRAFMDNTHFEGRTAVADRERHEGFLADVMEGYDNPSYFKTEKGRAALDMVQDITTFNAHQVAGGKF